MALEPPRALPDQTLQFDDALLVYGCSGAVFVAPSGGEQPDSEIEIVCQAAGPRSRPQCAKGREPHELPVATQAHAAEMAPTALEDLGVDDEFHVLHPREQAGVTVVDADADLHRTHLWIGEAGADHGDAVWFEPAIRIDDHDDDVGWITVGE